MLLLIGFSSELDTDKTKKCSKQIDFLRELRWTLIKPFLEQFFNVSEDSTYCSILPTSTQYARNSIFSGLFPSQIKKQFPNYWVEDYEEGGKNLYEKELFEELLKRENKTYTLQH